jgi:hypothetical protein
MVYCNDDKKLGQKNHAFFCFYEQKLYALHPTFFGFIYFWHFSPLPPILPIVPVNVKIFPSLISWAKGQEVMLSL